MNIPDEIVLTVFGMFAVLFFGGNIYEWWGMKKFILKVYTLGPRIFSSKEFWDTMSGPSEEIFKTASGSFKIIDKNQLLFKFDLLLFGFQFRTPFPLKGLLGLEGNTATISARAPITTTIFMMFWLAGWTCISITILFSKDTELYIGVLTMMAGWIGCGLMVYLSYTIEKKRLLKVLSEIKTHKFP